VQDFGRSKSKAIVFKITNEAGAPIHYTVDGRSFTLYPYYTVTHQRSRTPELDFLEARGKGDAEKFGDEVFHPRGGTHFTVRGSHADGYTVDAQ
jgi:hypothetical protein